MENTPSAPNTPVSETIVQLSRVRKLFLPLGHEVGVLIHDVIGPLCTTCGITLQQFYVLSELKESPDLTISQLCDKTGMLRANFAVTFRRMERKGLVVKTPRAGDRRSYTLKLTPEGRGLLDDIDREWSCQLGRLFDQASQQELEQIAEGLTALSSLLQRRH